MDVDMDTIRNKIDQLPLDTMALSICIHSKIKRLIELLPIGWDSCNAQVRARALHRSHHGDTTELQHIHQRILRLHTINAININHG